MLSRRYFLPNDNFKAKISLLEMPLFPFFCHFLRRKSSKRHNFTAIFDTKENDDNRIIYTKE